MSRAGERFLGLDFGTGSVRALLVDAGGHIEATATSDYFHGTITRGSPTAQRLFTTDLAPSTALQDPGDWLTAAGAAVRAVIGDPSPGPVAGIGVAFTSCTMLPTGRDGTPLAQRFPQHPHAWAKLWKHHGAGAAAAHMTEVAKGRGERWLDRYGGVIGLEWFFPKVLEVLEEDPKIGAEADVWVEAGDWLVWQLTGDLVRSTCQAGYKALWSREDGFPSADYLGACHPELPVVLDQRLPGCLRAPGERAGALSAAGAALLGLSVGIPVSAATIDAHAGVPGAGVSEPGTLVMVLGTSGCHMTMAPDEHVIPGVAGVVADGILPGWYGYETGQAAVGDAFEWARRLCGAPEHATLEQDARLVPAGSDGLLAVDWFNGCRTPLMDGRLRGAMLGIDLHHGPAHLYRAVLEASACGLGWIIDTLRDGGIALDRFVATGGLPRQNALFVEIIAGVLDEPIEVCQLDHGPALGAAILGALAAGHFDHAAEAVASMAGSASAVPRPMVVEPPAGFGPAYAELTGRYRDATSLLAGPFRSTPRPTEEPPCP